MSEVLENAKKICITILSNERGTVTAAVINSAIEMVTKIYPLTAEEKEKLFRQLEILYAVFSDEYRILDDSDSTPQAWVKNRKADFKWEFWNRYRLFLEGKNFAPDTLNKLDNLTDDILDRLISPGSHERFDKRGLIVGHVQSGKTSNYTALICKAADVGYKLIIVLAGIHNSLRSQTQLRIDEGFLGFDTQTARNFAQTSNRIGVGKINPNLAAHSLTTSDVNGDFNRRASEASGINIRGNDPIILVIKKNYSVLKNLLLWLASRGETMHDDKKLIRNLPLLLIDDEADNASINISKSEVSRINGGIRAMLMLFEQSAYIGYTATPYANIFIKDFTTEEIKGLNLNFDAISFTLGKDIFPKDFIINIPAPSNYIGPSKIFGIVSSEQIDKEVQPISLYRIVDDYQPKKAPESDEDAYKLYQETIEDIRKRNTSFITDYHRKDDQFPSELPESLKYAIKCFFLACAARRARGQEKEHNSMLIHVSRFIRWQDNIAALVLNVFKFYSRQLEFKQGSLLSELKDIWEKEFILQTRELINNKSVNDPGIVETTWNDLALHIYPAVSKIDIRAVHGDTRIQGLEHKNIRPLDYFEQRNTGLSVIAIGGNKLSRGLTLEGLTISYYLRASKMYDTLMQMGRWFGFRPGYLDLCRLFTSEELVEWYRHITVATEEMRAEFDRMCDLGKKPLDYGLKVRTHPGVLSITASNKFRYKKIMELSYSGELEETYSFNKYSDLVRVNLDNTVAFLRKLQRPDGAPNTVDAFDKHYVWTGRNNYSLILEFLNSYKSFQPTSFNVPLMAEYILAQVKHGRLKNWTIALINNSIAKADKKYVLAPGINIGLTERSNAAAETEPSYEINKSHIIDPLHEYIDLTDPQIQKAYADTYTDLKKKEDVEKRDRPPKTIKHPSPLRIKTSRPPENGLLLIYFLDPHPTKSITPLADCPIIGLAISFPDIENDEKIEYAVNKQFLDQYDYADEIDEEEEEESWETDNSEKTTELRQHILRQLDDNRNFSTNVNLQIRQGITGTYRDISTEPVKEGETDIILADPLPINSATSQTFVPFVQQRNLDRYHVRNSGLWVVNPSSVKELGKNTILGTLREDEFVFALAEEVCELESGCVGITVEDTAPGYILAILNSAIFGFWVKMRKIENIDEAMAGFPFRTTGETGTLAYITSSISILLRSFDNREFRVISSYLISLLDTAISEIYFPEEFREHKISVLAQLKDIDTSSTDVNEIKKLYKKLSQSGSPVHKALRATAGIEKIRLIYDYLKQ